MALGHYFLKYGILNGQTSSDRKNGIDKVRSDLDMRPPVGYMHNLANELDITG